MYHGCIGEHSKIALRLNTFFDNPEKILTWCQKRKFKFSSDNQSGMNKFNPLQELNFSRNISEHWKLWKQELMLYITVTEKIKKSDDVKSSILLTCIGPRGREVYNTFVFDDDSMKMNFNCILQQFDDYYSPQKNVTFLQYKFFLYRQSEGQCFDNFVLELKKLSKE